MSSIRARMTRLSLKGLQYVLSFTALTVRASPIKTNPKNNFQTIHIP
jgi:hypothetical protein